jgi:hypothetical protein
MEPDAIDRRLDGNAAAGLLAEVFRVEMTTADVRCAGCGTVGPVGALMNYGHGMGVILRCPGCDTPVIRLAPTRSAYWLDVRGAVSLRISGGVGVLLASHGATGGDEYTTPRTSSSSTTRTSTLRASATTS